MICNCVCLISLLNFVCNCMHIANISIILLCCAFAAGIPNVRWFGVEGDYSALVMDLLGANLQELFESCDAKLSLKTVLMLADQMVHLCNCN